MDGQTNVMRVITLLTIFNVLKLVVIVVGISEPAGVVGPVPPEVNTSRCSVLLKETEDITGKLL